MSLNLRILSIVALASALCAGIAIYGFTYFNNQELYRGVISKSRTVHSRLEAATEYVAGQGGLAPTIERFRTKYKSAEEMTKADKLDVLKQVPIFAAMKIGAKDSEKEGYNFRIFSTEPRNPENRATAHEAEIYDLFEKDPSKTEWVENDGQMITVYRAVRLDEGKGCLHCHGAPAESPWGNGTDILGYKMEDWKHNRLHGVFAIRTDLEAIVKAENDIHTIAPANVLKLAILGGALLSLIIAFILVMSPIRILSRIAQTLAQSSQTVGGTSEAIARSAEDLARASHEQASSLSQTTASIEEMSAMVRRNSDNATKASDSSQRSQASATEGQKVVQEMLTSMEDINGSNARIMEQVEKSNQRIAEIVKVIEAIGDKTKVINDIVFQTKLLSFNASVEAARAGEHGKGFSVVAEEVGNLAAMSGKAALEISTMLADSVGQVDGIVTDTKTQVGRLIDEGREKIEAGSRIAERCAEVLGGLVADVGAVNGMAGDISSASQEQSIGIREISKAMSQLDQVTQENAATSETTAESADVLKSQSSELQSAVSELMGVIHGSTRKAS